MDKAGILIVNKSWNDQNQQCVGPSLNTFIPHSPKPVRKTVNIYYIIINF